MTVLTTCLALARRTQAESLVVTIVRGITPARLLHRRYALRPSQAVLRQCVLQYRYSRYLPEILIGY